MLVWMTVTHLPTSLSNWTNQPFGFVSASEGFIFLAALFTGRIYFRLGERSGALAMCRKLWARALDLYGYHLLLLSFAFLVMGTIATRGDFPAVHNLLDYYFATGHEQALVEGALLIYRPPLLDILPMYIIFLLLTSVLLVVTARVGWKYILGGSFTIWLAAQFGFGELLHGFLARHFGLAIPINEMGSFDTWAWQLVWVFGLWFGVRWAKDDLPLGRWAKRLTIPALMVVPALIAARYATMNVSDFGMLGPALDKWHLGAVRLVDFAAIAVLLVRFQKMVKPLAVKPLIVLGQSSLQVFCVHLLFVFFGLAVMGTAEVMSGWQKLAVLAVTFPALLLTAKHAADAKSVRPGRSQKLAQVHG